LGTYSGFWIFRILARAAIYGDIFDRTDMAPASVCRIYGGWRRDFFVFDFREKFERLLA
jgi:hypothetical protein